MKVTYNGNPGINTAAQAATGAGLVVLGNQPHLVGTGGAHTFLIVWGIIMIIGASWGKD